MDDIKLRLSAAVAAQLSAAPRSDAKDELIEELSDNLYRRFLDMTGAGVPEDEAFQRALDDLGDVDELLAYLGVEPVNMNITLSSDGRPTRIETESGEVFTVTGDSAQDQPQGAAEEQTSGGDAAPEGRRDAQGDVHYDYKPGADIPQSDLDAILAGVSEVCNTAIDQAKAALKQAKAAIQRRTTWEKDNGHVKVHFNAGPDMPHTPPAPPTPPTPPTPPAGWEFEAELDSDEGRFFAGGGPKERKDVVYGFGYDKTKGGFFAQWGEYTGGKDDGRTGPGPYFDGENSYMEHQDDGTYSVTALKDLRGIEVQTNAGDVSIHISEAPDAGVIIDGDVDDLNVTCSADGVLTIREGRTASSSFFSRRGIGSADVELYLPSRHWEMITVSTASGDVDIDRDRLDVDHLTVSTASGDLSVRLRACRMLSFKSASGDLDLDGTCTSLLAETMSGDISLRGQVEDARLKSTSGDIELAGLVSHFHGSTISGDVSLVSSVMPQAMDMSSKSGDCEARIPDAGPFTLRMKTVTGELDCAFPVNYINGVCVYGDGTGPAYSMTTVSGDVSLERY